MFEEKKKREKHITYNDILVFSVEEKKVDLNIFSPHFHSIQTNGG